jgi:dTDP-4-dehydrorhamnose reductase
MKIAVIGANGFVGKNLVKVLKKKYDLIKITSEDKIFNS